VPRQEVAVGRAFINLRPEITAAILRTVEAGWLLACLRVDVEASAGEVVMTECLRDGMRAALKNFPWQATMVVLPGTESRSTTDVLIPDGRTDIPILVIPVFDELREHDPHAIIECKRLSASDAHLVREYVVQGIDRFITGKYSGSHRRGFMAGYIIAGDVPAAVAAINDYLAKNGRTPEQLKDSTLFDADWARVSEHPRPVGTSIELHHALLLVA
jgi:hypothetical protein